MRLRLQFRTDVACDRLTMLPDSDQNLSPLARRGEELDRKLGVLWSRFWSLVVGSAGLALLFWFFTRATNATLGSTAFISAIGLGLLLLARHLWRNKDSLTAILDDVDEPARRSKKQSR